MLVIAWAVSGDPERGAGRGHGSHCLPVRQADIRRGHRQQPPGQFIARLLRRQATQLTLEVAQPRRLGPALRARREVRVRAVQSAAGQLTVDEGRELIS